MPLNIYFIIQESFENEIRSDDEDFTKRWLALLRNGISMKRYCIIYFILFFFGGGDFNVNISFVI